MFTKFKTTSTQQNIYVFQGSAEDGGVIEALLKQAQANGHAFTYERVTVPLKCVIQITTTAEEIAKLQRYLQDRLGIQ